MRIIEDKVHSNMYRLEWPNGDISVGTDNPKPWEKRGHYGFYNKTRATEFLKREGIENYDRRVTYEDPLGRPEKLTGAFK